MVAHGGEGSDPRGARRRRGRTRIAGFAYAAVMVLVAVLSAVTLTYAHRASIGRSAAMDRRNTMRADYLARAAASRAVWLLLKEPWQITDSDTYFMHDFAGGRYGYMVRKNTSKTYATVATIGIVGENVAERSYVVCITNN